MEPAFMKGATCAVVGGRRRLMYSMGKTEVVEEYDLKTHEIILRRVKVQSDTKESQWVVEIGESTPTKEGDLIASTTNPVFMRKDTAKAYQFRIRNLPYPVEVYSVEVDSEKQQIVVRTSNKKYFKRIEITDMKRMGLKLRPEDLSFSYGSNTLLVSYQKPSAVLAQEAELRREFEKLNQKKPKEGDLQCIQQ